MLCVPWHGTDTAKGTERFRSNLDVRGITLGMPVAFARCVTWATRHRLGQTTFTPIPQQASAEGFMEGAGKGHPTASALALPGPTWEWRRGRKGGRWVL